MRCVLSACPAMAHEHRGRGHGPLQPVSNHTIRPDRIRAHREDMLLVAGPVGPAGGHALAIVDRLPLGGATTVNQYSPSA